MREYVSGLDPKEIGNVAKELRKYKTELRHNILALIDVMCEEGEHLAVLGITHFDTGETAASIKGYREGDIGLIVAGGHAVWVEFGAGMGRAEWVGTDYPEGVVRHGEYGQGKGMNPPWVYKAEDGTFHKSYGIDADSFMYYAAKDLAAKTPELAMRIFNGK